jgi:hypothetical protein
MQTSSFWGIGTAWVAAGALVVGCGGSEFQSADNRSRVLVDAGGELDGANTGAGGNTAAGGRGSSGTTNGGAASTGGTRNGGGGSGALGSGGSGGRAGTGGSSGSGGNLGRGGNPDGAGGDTTSTGGAGGTQNTGGTSVCSSPTTFYPDTDQDTYGRSTGTVTGCTAPANGNWSTVGGDCDDNEKDVFPKQPTYFDSSYSTSGGNHSFDYDCSGIEEGAAGEAGAPPGCSSLLGIGCTGTGYVPTTRSGPGVNPLCGSTTQATCRSTGLACTSVVSTAPAYRCK